jgi:ribosomal protein RSM22 (predicted rRNA methylase)
MHHLSPAVWDTLAAVSRLKNHLSLQNIPQSIADGVSRLSELFTRGGKGKKATYLDDPLLCASYLAYYVPVNLSKVQLLLNELRPAFPTVPREEFRVLDVGGGPGTGALATLDWFRSTSSALSPAAIRMTVVDHSARALTLCAELWQTYQRTQTCSISPPLQTIEHNLERALPSCIRAVGVEKGYDLIIVQNVLSELFIWSIDPIDQRATFVQTLLNCLNRNGSLMLVEPALRSASRGLHQVRDKLLAGQLCSVYSPCLHDAPCPALVKPDDWCHEERKWATPDWITQIDTKVGFIKDALKFSYVILRKDGKTLVPRRDDYHRVVSELRVMKGEKRVWLCDKTGRPEVGRQDKERSSSNATFDQWHRGAIVRVSEIVRQERKGKPAMVGRILSSGTAEVVRPV